MNDVTILIADDEAGVLAVLQSLLKTQGYRTESASSSGAILRLAPARSARRCLSVAPCWSPRSPCLLAPRLPRRAGGSHDFTTKKRIDKETLE